MKSFKQYMDLSKESLRKVTDKRGVTEEELDALHLALSGQTAEEIAPTLGISAAAVRKRLGAIYQKFDIVGNTAGKLEVLRGILQQEYQLSQVEKKQGYQDWGEAAEVPEFYGRTEDLATLEQWLVQADCRLVAVLGMGGIGKTTLTIKLARQVADKFQYVIWRSLREAPTIQSVLTDLLNSLSNQKEVNLPESVSGKISVLIDYLHSSRCLVIFDNLESILQSGTQAGKYREGYEEYRYLFRRVGESEHKSCLILTSREKPAEIALLETETLRTRALNLKGLEPPGAQQILKEKGLSGSKEKILELIDMYDRNPLALKIVSTVIKELFDSKISSFLLQETFVFSDIRELLDKQFERLSKLEKTIMYWLAINRKPITVAELREDIVPPEPLPRLLEALDYLKRRSLIETSARGFTLQNVIMEYMTNRLIEQVSSEIKSGEIDSLNTYALMKATANEHVREAQVRLILKPVLASLTDVEKQLQTILASLKFHSQILIGYAGGNILNLLLDKEVKLNGYNFSNLEIRQAYLREASLHNVDFTDADFSKSVFSENFSNVLSVAFSPNGEHLAIGDAKGEIRLWRVKDGQQISTYKGHSNRVWSVAFTADGKTIVSGSEDQTIRLWSLDTGKCLKVLQDSGSKVWAIALATDEVVISADGQTVKIWNIRTGEHLSTLEEHEHRVMSVASSSDGQFIVSSSEDQRIILWNVHTGKYLKELEELAWSVTFSPDGQTIASGNEDYTVKLRRIDADVEPKELKGHTNRVMSVAFSPDGKIIASGSDDQTVRLWDVDTGEHLNVLEGHTNRIWSVAFSPDGKIIASGSDDQTVRLWDVDTGECLKVLKGYTNWITSIAFSPNGKTIASGSDDQTVRLWKVDTGDDQTVGLWDVDTEDGNCFKELKGHKNRIWSVAFSPDGEIIASGSDDQTVRLWDVDTGEHLNVLKGHTNRVMSVAFSPDGKIIASGSEDQTVRLWDAHTGEFLKYLPHPSRMPHPSRIWSVAFSLDSTILATGSDDAIVRLWDVASGECVKELPKHTDKVWSVAFSPDGTTLISGGDDRTVRIWQISSGKLLKTLPDHTETGHTDRIWSVAFSPDGSIIATGSDDKTVKIWNSQTGECLRTWEKLSSRVRAVAFSPDNQLLASAGEDEMIRFWNFSTGEQICSLRNPGLYKKMNITGVKGLTESQKTTLRTLGAIET
jgi:WD40 repeat protein/DNA-binding CsgD family transcriptional regulator